MDRTSTRIVIIFLAGGLVACGGRATPIGGDGDSDSDCDPPANHPADCSLVTDFQCGLEAGCEDGVVVAMWHEHVYCDGQEDIDHYSCEYVCPHGCRFEGNVRGEHNGQDLVASACGEPGECEPGMCRYCERSLGSEIGTQHCRLNGAGWEPCGEASPPRSCSTGWYSREFVECCVEQGFCCEDGEDYSAQPGSRRSIGDCAVGGCEDPDAETECEPGSCRICSPPAYDGFGTQTCVRDGTWGPCNEEHIVEECHHDGGWYSPCEAACCVMRGYCCQDMWDLDRDGDTWESLGECGERGCGRGGVVPWVCVPRDERYCDPPVTGGWGQQTCLEDGSGWGSCDEVLPPEECESFMEYGEEGQRCCMEHRLCCQDYWDLDLDGERRDSIGACEEDCG